MPFDFGQLKYLLHFLCLVLLHAKQDGRNTERKGPEEFKQKNGKERKRIKDQQIPALLSTLFAHLLCIRVQGSLSRGMGSSAQTL